VPLITRATFRVGLLWAMGFIAAAYVSAPTLNGLGLGPAKDGCTKRSSTAGLAY